MNSNETFWKPPKKATALAVLLSLKRPFREETVLRRYQFLQAKSYSDPFTYHHYPLQHDNIYLNPETTADLLCFSPEELFLDMFTQAMKSS